MQSDKGGTIRQLQRGKDNTFNKDILKISNLVPLFAPVEARTDCAWK